MGDKAWLIKLACSDCGALWTTEPPHICDPALLIKLLRDARAEIERLKSVVEDAYCRGVESERAAVKGGE